MTFPKLNYLVPLTLMIENADVNSIMLSLFITYPPMLEQKKFKMSDYRKFLTLCQTAQNKFECQHFLDIFFFPNGDYGSEKRYFTTGRSSYIDESTGNVSHCSPHKPSCIAAVLEFMHPLSRGVIRSLQLLGSRNRYPIGKCGCVVNA